MRRNIMPLWAGLALATACVGTPGPGEGRYDYGVDGRYSGTLVVDGERFVGTLDLATGRNGAVSGSFDVSAPLEIDGSVEGVVVDDLVRLTLTYDRPDGSAGTCESRIEGILTVSPGAAALEGPVTITDCGVDVPGRMSFQLQSSSSVTFPT